MKKVLVLLIGLGIALSSVSMQMAMVMAMDMDMSMSMPMTMSMAMNEDLEEDMVHCLICTEEETIAGKCETPELALADEDQPVDEDREAEDTASASGQTGCDCDMKTDEQDQVAAVYVVPSVQKTSKGFASVYMAMFINNKTVKKLFSNLSLGRSPPAQYLAHLSTVQQLR